MKKVIVKIELDGNSIGTKPLLPDDTLASIRDKIKEKTKGKNYIFLDSDGNDIEKSDENDYTLKDIINEKKIKIKSTQNEIEDSGQLKIKIFLNDKQILSKNITKNSHLDKVRKFLEKENIKDFDFLDPDECIIERQDEKEYSVEDILNNEAIKLKCDKPSPTSITKTEPPKSNKSPKTDVEPTPAPPAKIKYNLSKYQELKLDDYETGDIKLYKYSNITGVNKGMREFMNIFLINLMRTMKVKPK